MSDYLSNLVGRHLDRIEVVEPRLASRFEPPSATFAPGAQSFGGVARSSMPEVKVEAEFNAEGPIDPPPGAPSLPAWSCRTPIAPRRPTQLDPPREPSGDVLLDADVRSRRTAAVGQAGANALPTGETVDILLIDQPAAVRASPPPTREALPVQASLRASSSAQDGTSPGRRNRPAWVGAGDKSGEVTSAHAEPPPSGSEISDFSLKSNRTLLVPAVQPRGVDHQASSLKTAPPGGTALSDTLRDSAVQTASPPGLAERPNPNGQKADRIVVERRVPPPPRRTTEEAAIVESRPMTTPLPTMPTPARPPNEAAAMAAARRYDARRIEPKSQMQAESRPTAAEPGPTINVTIGRIEVRAAPAATVALSRQQRQAAPLMSLDDYLRQRGGGGDR